MNSLYSDLQWLPRAPGDFGARLSKLLEEDLPLGTSIQRLATHALDINQMGKLSHAIDGFRAEGRSLSPLTPFRLAVLSNSTFDLIVPALVASAARHGIALELIRTGYDQVAQEALVADSVTNSSDADAVLLALDYRALPIKLTLGDVQGCEDAIDGAIGFLQTLRDGIKRNSAAACILQSLAPPVETLFGSYDRVLPGAMRHVLDRVNADLVNHVLRSGDLLLDAAAMAESVGLAEWHDTQLWNLGKIPFAPQFISLYAEQTARLLAAMRGKSRRVLIVDLDNTLWGGVIGDDGLEGIKIAQGDPIGEAHLALQKYALSLRERGVVLAVSSKNNDEVARLPFEQHPEMLLRLEHIAVFQANWTDKATNIKAIADQLCLGLDAMVFLDDNPAERGLVRELLPQVAVPELPEEPAYYTRTLAAAGYFESYSFTTEDRARGELYRDNARRASLRSKVGGVEAYLRSLGMTISFAPFDATGRARIVQLINKSNQYNLTTRRYNEAEVAAAESDPSVFTLQVRLADIFGDNGMISVVICRDRGAAIWDIDTWLMSCRVLGRGVENMVLREILKHAREAGVTELVGAYRPTVRNKLVVDHYQKLGFTKTAEDPDGNTQWAFAVQSPDPPEAPMKVVSQGFKAQAEAIA
jgi:FkbH-like protein